jgi:tellurite resistance protein TerC
MADRRQARRRSRGPVEAVLAMTPHGWFWVSFIALFLAVFVVDFSVTGRRTRPFTPGVALRWTALWIGVALAYAAAIYAFYPQAPGSPVRTGTQVMLKFVSGYVTEYTLSVDNLFVFVMIFAVMGVGERLQPRLLKAGIVLSIVLRILFITLGMGIVQRFHWVLYLFGAVLLWTAWKMAFSGEDEETDPRQNILYRAASRWLPVDPDPDTPRFFTRIDGRFAVTAMFLVLLVIGSTDVLFAVDSIPAIIGVIREGATGVLSPGDERFVAVTSNVFAVMGLVSLFFALRGVMDMFRYLKIGVSVVLAFIGAKMTFGFLPAEEAFFKQHSWVSLAVIVASLAGAIALSRVVAPDEAANAVPAETAEEDS